MRFTIIIAVAIVVAGAIAGAVVGLLGQRSPAPDDTIERTITAAQQGDAEAQFALAGMYRSGDRVTQNLAEASTWYRNAAEQGHAQARNALGLMYAEGLGVAKDFGNALKWFRLAAEQGEPSAQANMGEMYREAKGVSYNLERAYMWYSLAAEQGHQGGAANRQLIAKRLAAPRISNAEALLQEWKREHLEAAGVATLGAEPEEAEARRAPRDANEYSEADDVGEKIAALQPAAEQGDADAQFRLGTLHHGGRPVPRDGIAAIDWIDEAQGRKKEEYVEALKWYELAAAQDHVRGVFYLGIMHWMGLGTDRDFTRAFELVRQSAERNLPLAQNILGRMYMQGHGVERDMTEAATWLRRAADQGLAEAQNTLATLYVEGAGVPKDQAKALGLYEKAARQGHALAMVNTGTFYAINKRDFIRAYMWDFLAAEHGHEVGERDIKTLATMMTGAQIRQAKRLAREVRKELPTFTRATSARRSTPSESGAEGREQYLAAAEQGDPEAQVAHGDLMYGGGKGVAPDFEAAAIWYRKAAEQNHATAQVRLARLYLYGQGVPTDRVQAYMWAFLAAAQGDTAAQQDLSSITTGMSLDDVEEAKQLARQWRRNH